MFYIIPTPIGNLKDITRRSLEILSNVDVIYCEDTRVTARLLQYYQISKPLKIYNDFSDEKTRNEISGLLSEGKNIGLVSDAGMPLISDPGYKLIQFLADKSHSYTILPGPCAAITALAGSSLATDNFLFLGFLPNTSNKRKEKLTEIKNLKTTLIIYIPIHKLEDNLIDIFEIFGNRKACIAREITKEFEEYKIFYLNESRDILKNMVLKGEIVLIVEGNNNEETRLDKVEIEKAINLSLQYMSAKDSAKLLSQIYSLKKNDVYEQILRIKKNDKYKQD